MHASSSWIPEQGRTAMVARNCFGRSTEAVTQLFQSEGGGGSITYFRTEVCGAKTTIFWTVFDGGVTTPVITVVYSGALISLVTAFCDRTIFSRHCWKNPIGSLTQSYLPIVEL